MRWFARHPALTTVVLIVLIVGPGYYRLEQTIDDQDRIIEQACDDRRDNVVILRELVDLSDDGRGGMNLTGLPSFQELSPETQRYLRDLETAANQSPRPSSFVKNALALLEVPDC